MQIARDFSDPHKSDQGGVNERCPTKILQNHLHGRYLAPSSLTHHASRRATAALSRGLGFRLGFAQRQDQRSRVAPIVELVKAREDTTEQQEGAATAAL